MAEETKKQEENKKEKQEVKVPAKFKGIVEQIETMSVVDLSELVAVLEEKFGVFSQAMVAPIAAAPAVASGDEEESEEQSSFNVELTETGGNKIAVIKAIREFVSIGLKDAKDLVDSAPKVVKEGVNKEDAEKMKAKLEEAGGKVTLK